MFSNKFRHPSLLKVIPLTEKVSIHDNFNFMSNDLLGFRFPVTALWTNLNDPLIAYSHFS